MMHELHHCAQLGWGMGVHDLDDAFEHIIDHGNTWTDGNIARYYGGDGKCFRAAGSLLNAPEAAVNFLNGVDALMADAKSAAAANIALISRLNLQQQRDAPWEELKGTLGSMKTGPERVQHLLWWTPRVRSGVRTGISVMDTISGLDQAIEMYQRGRRAGMAPGLSAGLVTLREVMSFVPIIDSCYGSIVEGIPDLVNWYRGLIQNRVDQIELACQGQ